MIAEDDMVNYQNWASKIAEVDEINWDRDLEDTSDLLKELYEDAKRSSNS